MLETNETEQKILDAAKQEFETKGYNGVRMQKIADAAGISKASLHYYFRSKDNLFKKVFDQAMSEYLPLLNTWTDDSLNWEQKIRKFISDFTEFSEKGSLLFIIRELNRRPELLTEIIKNSKSPNRFVAYFEKITTTNTISTDEIRAFYIILQSICCFPTVNEIVLKKSLRLSDKQYKELMQGYASVAADFFINALKNKIKNV